MDFLPKLFASRQPARPPSTPGPSRPALAPSVTPLARHAMTAGMARSSFVLAAPAAPANSPIPSQINLFRASMSAKNPEPAFAFSPRLSRSSLHPPRPPTPLNRAVNPLSRLADNNATKMTLDDPFEMRIPSPAPELSGPRLTNEARQFQASKGNVSAYTDEYLAYLCPPDFDEQQRRQWFCILDLRRLKYAASEVFSKRDWKLNVLAFAKEYERNRSLILLRYGFLQFKSVRPSNALVKKWRQENGIPSFDEEQPNGGPPRVSFAKRKADELSSTDVPAQKSKRRVTEHTAEPDAADAPPQDGQSFDADLPAEPATNRRLFQPADKLGPLNDRKRKAHVSDDDEVDSQPSKLQKSSSPKKNATPSATKSLFERIANNVQDDAASQSTNGVPSPEKQLPKPASERPALSSSNAFLQAVTDTAKKAISRAASPPMSVLTNGDDVFSSNRDNIFGYLPGAAAENSKVPGNEAEDEHEESHEADHATTTDAIKVGSETGHDLLSRTTRSDGNLARFSPLKENEPAEMPNPASGTIATAVDNEPARSSPSNNTWNVNTPIKFAPSAVPQTDKPAAAPALNFFGQTQEEASAPAILKDIITPTPNTASTIFGNQPATEPPKKSIFGNVPSAGSAEKSFNIFDPSKNTTAADTNEGFTERLKPASTAQPGGSLFGTPAKSTGALFGLQSKSYNANASGIFGSQPDKIQSSVVGAAQPDATPDPTALFRVRGKDAETTKSVLPTVSESTTSASHLQPASQPQPVSQLATPSDKTSEKKDMFANLTSMKQYKFPGPPASLGDVSAENPASSGQQTPLPKTPFGAKPAAPAILFPTSGVSFSGRAASPGAKLFEAKSASLTPVGVSNASNEPVKSSTPSFSFGTTTTAQTLNPKSAPLFGQTASGPAGPARQPATPATSAPTSLFGTATATESKPLFGAATPAEAKPLSGATAPTMFGAPSAQQAKPLFGNTGIAKPEQSDATTDTPVTSAPASIFNYGVGTTAAPAVAASALSTTNSSAPASFSFGGNTLGSSSMTNPFGGSNAVSFDFGAKPASSTSFVFNAGATSGAPPPPAVPVYFGATQTNSQSQASLFSAPSPGPVAFSFGSQPTAPSFESNPAIGNSGVSFAAAPSINFGGASSLSTPQTAGTPEPVLSGSVVQNDAQADADEPQAQIRLTDGGPGEEHEEVVREFRAKVLKYVKPDPAEDGADGKSPWKVAGVGPLRILKHKDTGAARLLLRTEPRGNVVLNTGIFDQEFSTAMGGKYVRMLAQSAGGSLETLMLQVKTKETANELADVLNAHKK